MPKIQAFLARHQVGISESKTHYCVVFSQHNVLVCHWWEKSGGFSLVEKIQCEIPVADPCIVRPIPYRFIWRKVLFVSEHYTSLQLYQQVIAYLTQHLPLALEEVYFDYQAEKLPENQVIRLVIYALKRSYADPLMLAPTTILDCELLCFVRGYHAFSEQPISSLLNKIYAFDHIFAQFTPNELVLHTQKPAGDIIDLSTLYFPLEIIDPKTYLTALGAYLWDGTE